MRVGSAAAIVLACGIALPLGCGSSRDEALYDELADSVDAALVLGVFVRGHGSPAIADGLVGAAEEYAAVAADEAPAMYTPDGCATATAAGAVVTLVFDQCNGPGAIRDLSGTLSMTYGASAPNCMGCPQEVAGVSLATTDLRANDLEISIGDTITVRGPRGTSFTMGGHFESTSIGACTTLLDTIWTVDGEYTNAGTNHLVSNFGYQRCAGGCPVGNVWRHSSTIAGQVDIFADEPLHYLGNESVEVETVEGTISIDARCD